MRMTTWSRRAAPGACVRVPDRPGFRADASAEPAASPRRALSPPAQGRVLTRPAAVPAHSQQRAPGPARPLQTRGFRVGERDCDSGQRRHLRGPGSVLRVRPAGGTSARAPRQRGPCRSALARCRADAGGEERRGGGGGGEKEEETQEQETQEQRGRRAAAAPAQRSRWSAGNPSPRRALPALPRLPPVPRAVGAPIGRSSRGSRGAAGPESGPKRSPAALCPSVHPWAAGAARRSHVAAAASPPRFGNYLFLFIYFFLGGAGARPNCLSRPPSRFFPSARRISLSKPRGSERAGP